MLSNDNVLSFQVDFGLERRVLIALLAHDT